MESFVPGSQKSVLLAEDFNSALHAVAVPRDRLGNLNALLDPR